MVTFEGVLSIVLSGLKVEGTVLSLREPFLSQGFKQRPIVYLSQRTERPYCIVWTLELGHSSELDLEAAVILTKQLSFSNFSFSRFYEEIDSPTNVVTDRVTEDTAVVSWAPVQATIDKYVVRYTSADGDTRDMAVPKEQSSTVLTGLKPGEAYRVYVWAERGNQESKKANTDTLTGKRGMGASLGFLMAGRQLVCESEPDAHLASAPLLAGMGKGVAKAI